MPTLLSPTPSPALPEISPSPALPEILLALAPLHLPNRRRLRYQGDNMSVDLGGLADRDQTLLRNLYTRLTELLLAISDASIGDAGRWDAVLQWIQRHDLDTVLGEVQELGVASHAEQESELLSKCIHDVRGGALNALLGKLQLLDHLPRNSALLNMLFVLSRDHLKILRNAITGLDDARREADRKPKGHSIQLILDKWQEAIVGPKWRGRPIRMLMDCRYSGVLTECCLESAAIDRIFYNLTNNACRHTNSDHIDMVVFPLLEPPGECLRFVLSNEVSAEDDAYLSSMLRTGTDSEVPGACRNLVPLFDPAISSTGSGFGLTVVADFVAQAFGLRDRTEALRQRYVGAILDGRTFRTWFHWPMGREDLTPKLDDYRHSQESLSTE